MKKRQVISEVEAEVAQGIVNKVAMIRADSTVPPDEREQLKRDYLMILWSFALDDARNGDRHLVDALLRSGEQIPSDAYAALQEIENSRGRGRPPKITPERAVEEVRLAILRGHPYDITDDPKHNPAFAEAARRLGVSAGTVKRRYLEMRKEDRDEIKRQIEQAFGRFERETGKSFTERTDT